VLTQTDTGVTCNLYPYNLSFLLYIKTETIPDPNFSTVNMSYKYEAAARALKHIVKEGKYLFNPLIALDTKRRLILPTCYEHELSGVTVLVQISLTYDLF
jgi:hypothetical protein